MKNMWDARYAIEEYVYGREPNRFYRDSLSKYQIKGKILFPAEGEGRNAVYAAKQGLEVFAFDLSKEARKKGLRLAKEENVHIDYQQGDVFKLKYPRASFDVAVLIFAHFPPDQRNAIHKEIAGLIKSKGLLIMEAFSKDNYEKKMKDPSVGGPSNLEMLYTKDLIQEDFADFDILQLDETESRLHEGRFHKGMASVVRFVGRKK